MTQQASTSGAATEATGGASNVCQARVTEGRVTEGRVTRGQVTDGQVTRGRITQIDGVRTLAIAAVFLNHAFQAKLLWAGVDLFFILSGFLITGILIGAKEQGIGQYFRHFYERRARRILPPYVLLLAITSLYFGVSWWRYWYLYLGAMNWIKPLGVPYPPMLNILWSLAVEEQFYLVWPFVVFFLSETAIAWVAGGLVLLAPILRWTCTPFFPEHWQIYMLTPFRMDLLALGALLAVVWKRRRPLIERYGIYGPVASLLAGALLVLLGRNRGFSTMANTRVANVWIYELCLIAAAGIILWALSGRWVGVLRWGPMVYLGRISYSIYLIHTSALQFAERHMSGEGKIAAAGLVLTLVYAAVSWEWFEKPILYWRPGSAIRREAEADQRAVVKTEI